MISEKQKKILAFGYSKYDALICDGSIRAGKSSFEMISFIDWAMGTFNCQNFAICGKTVTSVYRNVVNPYMKLSYSRKKYIMQYLRSEHKLIIKYKGVENTFYLFGGKDESSFMLIQGVTLAGLFCDEVVLMCQSFVEQAIARCSVEGAKIYFNCNPDSPEHWFYKDWICDLERHNALYLHFNLEDNPSLSEKKIEWYKSQYTGRFYQKYIEGEWVSAEGLVYDCFSKEENVLSKESILDILKEGNCEYYLACDYGISNPFAVLLIALYNNTAYCIKEYYYDQSEHDGKRLTDEEHYKNIVKLANGYDIECLIFDPSATSLRETISRHDDFEDYRGARNNVMEGISYTTTLLCKHKLYISEECEHLLQELAVYSWDSDSSVDAVIKENDHACDALRYFCNTIAKSEIDLEYSEEDDDNDI